jgi:hypothetical protein
VTLLTLTDIPGCGEWKKAVAGSQTALNAESLNDVSRTTWPDVANSVHTTDTPAALMAHCRRASAWFVPKNREPDGVENDDTAEEMSDGVIDPKIAISNTGMESMDPNNTLEFVGGAEGEERRYWTRAVATLISEMEDKKFSRMWFRWLSVPYSRASSWSVVGFWGAVLLERELSRLFL